jgi:hypothetical protein
MMVFFSIHTWDSHSAKADATNVRNPVLPAISLGQQGDVARVSNQVRSELRRIEGVPATVDVAYGDMVITIHILKKIALEGAAGAGIPIYPAVKASISYLACLYCEEAGEKCIMDE